MGDHKTKYQQVSHGAPQHIDQLNTVEVRLWQYGNLKSARLSRVFEITAADSIPNLHMGAYISFS